MSVVAHETDEDLPAWSLPAGAGESIHLPSAWPERVSREWAWGGATGAGVRVCVLDSGVELDHPLVGPVQRSVAVTKEGDEITIADDDAGDLCGHGTACAGIIRRVAPECRLHSLRVLGERLTGKGAVFAAALRWAIDNHMHVVNMSLSTGKSDYFALFHELADLAYFNGVMLVCAVNNVPGPTYPSEYATVFSVAAHERKDPYGFDVNPAPPVEFGAPGIDVQVPWSNGTTITSTGNSFAAPHLAGLITLIRSKHPGLTPAEMKSRLDEWMKQFAAAHR